MTDELSVYLNYSTLHDRSPTASLPPPHAPPPCRLASLTCNRRLHRILLMEWIQRRHRHFASLHPSLSLSLPDRLALFDPMTLILRDTVDLWKGSR